MFNHAMFESMPWYIGLRYIRAKRRNGFIAFISLFALLGMMLGVFALVVVLSVMNGFDHEIKGRLLKVIPHGFIAKEGGLADWPALAARVQDTPGLVASAPYVQGKGILTYGARVRPIELHGILPEQEQGVSEVVNNIIVGDIGGLSQTRYGIVLGAIVARNLDVTIGDKVAVALPEVSVTPAGIFPRSKRFAVVAVFEVGAQVDQTMAMIHIDDARRLFRKGEYVDGLRLRYQDIYQALPKLKALGRDLGDEYVSKDWSETQGSLFAAVKMEKTVVGLMLSVIIAVAAFNIVSSLIMMVAEKRSDIAVLRTLGLSRAGVIKIFIVQGVVMGVTGVVVGGVLGSITAFYLSDFVGFLEGLLGFEVFDKDVYFTAFLPSVWMLEDVLRTSGFALVVSFLATIYPSYRASLIEPAEALRYDT